MADSNKTGFQIKIGTKIFGGFLILILLFTIIASIIFATGNNINRIVRNSSQVVNPMRDAINEWITLVHRSRMLITNWVYLQANEDDKSAFRLIISNQYPDVKKKINGLMTTAREGKVGADTTQNLLIDKAFKKFDLLLTQSEDNIVTKLRTFEDYEDGISKLLAGDFVDQEVIPSSDSIIKILTKVQEIQDKITAASEAQLVSATNNLQRNTLVFGIAIIALGLTFAYLLMRNITRPINYIRDIVIKLGMGELVEDKNTKFGRDEIGEMAAATDKLVNGLKATTMFAKNIGDGKYDSEFAPLSDHDVLGNALLEMRGNLSRVADEDKKRNWATEGMAKFGELLRLNTNDVNKLSDTLVSNLVKYLNANQGALYLIDDLESDEPTLSLTSCYAWNKKKFINQKIHKGEGLVGQAWQEMDVIYLTDVPNDYIKITSGLGDANPNCILIVPLKVNEQIFGVLEIASFNVLKDFEIEFVSKIAETLASTISTVKVNAKTQRLLEESQELTEQMRAQEEEMRQNMEELQATQEEMERGQTEAEANMGAINRALLVCEFGVDGSMQKANQNFLNTYGYVQSEIAGEQHKSFVHRDDKNYQDYRSFLANLGQGKPWKGEMKRQTKRGDLVSLWCSFNPVASKTGEIIKIIEISVNPA
jgi:PAS domain-containing protein/HAMP domain-containing protein